MKSTIERLSHRTEIGLAIGDREVSACVVLITPLKRTELGRATVTYEAEGLAEAIREAMAAAAKGRDPAGVKGRDLSGAKVAIGLPALQLFFSTRPIADKQLTESAQTLLHELIQSPTFVINDMSVDMVKHRSGKKTLAGLVSCRERYIAGILAALTTCGVRPMRAEPAPCGIARLASRMHAAPRKAGAVVRVFLGEKDGLAVLLSANDRPLYWRPFELAAGEERAAILAAMGSVRVHGRACGLEGGIGAVLIHGRPDLEGLDDLDDCPALENVPILRNDGPGLDGGNVALGLATLPKGDAEPFNLIRSLVGRPRYIDIFPWAETAVAATLLFAATVFFSSRLDRQRALARASQAEDARYKWAAKLSSEKLASEKKGLEAKIESIRSFLATRILWTSYTRELAGRLPPELAIAAVNGVQELDSPGLKSRPKRSLSVGFTAPIARTGAVPKEIDALLSNLRSAPLLKKEFPEVDLADLRWIPGTGKKPAMASFSVVCQPAKTEAAKPPAPKAKAR